MLLTKGDITLMIGLSTAPRHWTARLRRSFAGVFVLVILAAACGGDAASPSQAALPTDPTDIAPTDTATAPVDSTTPPDSTIPADSTTPTPIDSLGTPPADSSGVAGDMTVILDTRSSAPGIVFASDALPTDLLNSVHTGTKFGGAIGPSNILSVLAAVRARGGRILIKLSMGSDSYVKNSDGTFSFSKWKSLVDRFRSVNLNPYITDGTILGHFLIDEPHRTAKWGGKVISHSTLEAMAQYSKQIWPGMHTFTHTQMGWLAKTSVVYRHLDAGWASYTAGKGDVTKWVTTEIGYAKSKGLGLMPGMNVLAGGSSSSGITGYWPGKYAMSANEIRTYGSVLLNQSYTCAFMLWAYNSKYYGRSDTKTAMAEISAKARKHAKTSCRQ